MKSPCKKGLIPIFFIFLIERFDPIKNKLIWSPFFPNSLIVANPLKSGNIEFRNIARRKKMIKNGKVNFLFPSL